MNSYYVLLIVYVIVRALVWELENNIKKIKRKLYLIDKRLRRIEKKLKTKKIY